MKRFFCLLIIVALAAGSYAQVGVYRSAGAGAIKKEKKPHWTQPVKTGWQNTLLLNYEFTFCPGIHWNTGYRINKLLLVGAGLGYNYDWFTLDEGQHITTQWNGNSNWFTVDNLPAHRFPLYAQLAFYIIGERKVNPYIGISQGVDIILYGQNPKSDKMIGVGSHTRFDLGANFRLPKSGHSVLTTLEFGLSPVGRRYTSDIHHAGFIGFNVGFTF